MKADMLDVMIGNLSKFKVAIQVNPSIIVALLQNELNLLTLTVYRIEMVALL